MEARYVCVLGVDPGTTTGLAVCRFDAADGGRPEAVFGAQQEWQTACQSVEHLLEGFRQDLDAGRIEDAYAVREQYIINANTAQRGQQGADDALGMNGVVRRNAMLTRIKCPEPQQASAAKNLVQDGTLRRLNLFSPGLTHVNDAYRHALLFATKQKLMMGAWLAYGLEPKTYGE